MKQILKKVGLIFTLLVCTLLVTAGPKVKSTKWSRLAVNSLAVVNYKYQNCHLPSQGTHQEMVYLQLKNITKKTLVVSFDLLKYYNGECSNCNSSEDVKRVTFELAPNQTLEASCNENASNELKIFSKMLDFETSQVLTDFEIQNFQVEIK